MAFLFLIVVIVILNVNQHTDGYNICDRCQGRGSVMDVTVGMGQHGFLPSIVEIPCPICGGSGRR